MSPVMKWVREQLRIDDALEMRSDLALAGSRTFAIQLRVFSILSGTSSLAIVVLLRGALGADVEAMQYVLNAWIALFFVVVLFSMLSEVIAGERSLPGAEWVLRHCIAVATMLAVMVSLMWGGSVSEAAMLVAVAMMSLYGVRRTEPVIITDLSASEEGFWRRWCPSICVLATTLTMLLPALIFGPLAALCLPIIAGTAQIVLLMRTRWIVANVAQTASRRVVFEMTYTEVGARNLDTAFRRIGRRCVEAATATTAVVAAAIAAAAVGLLVVLAALWSISWF